MYIVDISKILESHSQAKYVEQIQTAESVGRVLKVYQLLILQGLCTSVYSILLCIEKKRLESHSVIQYL
jgi:hypothetical protein